ncbi:Fe(2+) transporter permease subunit FeoB [Candidatus Albibeggiatoa sp. nov. BB20]|uniref:Fe(2+) transporter permease subunit FeoB n=1 Tax=Candidatus Albibeggiatoa sp. nov. BB20 TaxID=3162723 RepID=UPI0033659B5E
MSDFVIGVVGNPNCGKTTLFNELTGSKQRVGNWSGVTVERKTGFYQFEDNDVEVVDLPGTYSLDVAIGHTSMDEEVAQQYILSGEADLIVNIIDAANLERNLYLTTQLLEMNVPMLIAVNMMDIAEQQNIQIDTDALSKNLGVPVLPLTAAKGKGVKELKHAINQAAAQSKPPESKAQYSPQIEQAINAVAPSLKTSLSPTQQDHIRWFSLKLLEESELVHIELTEEVQQQAEQLRTQIEENLKEDIDILIADGRYGFIGKVVNSALKRPDNKVSYTISDRIDNVVLNRTLGIPIFLAIMYLMFMFTINLGGAFIDFFDIFTGTLLVDGVAHVMGGLSMPTWLTTLVANGVGGGIQTVATFIPVIGFLFLFLSLLEDSGYMARAAFVMDRFMRYIGLPGKAFVPMIVGFGCNVPAIMATRTLENERDRRLTMLMNPFMSCGARLPVYALFAAAFFPTSGQNIVFGLYLTGILVAVITGLIMKNTLFKGEASHFVMELPPYHIPTVKGILLRTWDRLKGFIVRAGKIIVPMVVVISFLNSWGTDGTFGNDNTDKSVLSEIGRTLTPAFEPMGITEDNWPATVGIFTGILAKEVVVGTLDAVYSQLAADEAGEDEGEFNMMAGLSEAFATIPANISDLTDTITDPLGMSIGDVTDKGAVAEEQEISTGTFGAMVSRFGGTAAAFAYLLFILMYFPCTAATAAIYREAGARWAMFVAAWTTGVGYMSAVIFYQSATFSAHPAHSLAWIFGLLGLFSITLLALFAVSHVNRLQTRKPILAVAPATTTP